MPAVSELASLLAELESRWEQKGSDDYTLMLPGLDRAEVVRTLETKGLRAPGEVVDWFAWHNGVDNARAGSRGVEVAPSAFRQCSLLESLEERETWLRGAAQMAVNAGPAVDDEDRELVDPSFWWEPTWLPIGRGSGPMVLAIDLAGSSDTVPVLSVEWADIFEFRKPRVESLAAFVRLLLDLPDVSWRWLSDEQRWMIDDARFPIAAAQTALF
jgi:cell wall assembly regulator SMI1